jgi:sugar (pentulose or hexulose) kinase
MTSETDLLKEVEAAAERLAAVLDRIQRSIHGANERFRDKIGAIVGAAATHGLLDLDPNGDHLERVFDLWLDCNAGKFEARYGPGWRDRLAESASRTYGPNWKSAIVAGKDNNVRENYPGQERAT